MGMRMVEKVIEYTNELIFTKKEIEEILKKGASVLHRVLDIISERTKEAREKLNLGEEIVFKNKYIRFTIFSGGVYIDAGPDFKRSINPDYFKLVEDESVVEEFFLAYFFIKSVDEIVRFLKEKIEFYRSAKKEIAEVLEKIEEVLSPIIIAEELGK